MTIVNLYYYFKIPEESVTKLLENTVIGKYISRNSRLKSIVKFRRNTMSDLDRGIMKFKGADTPKAISISAIIILGSIVFLLFWGLSTAYQVG
ncbi:hypothetical protein [Okeania sp.]|uniref:hypothetical protein n=1 Tax=Okeania sp. TaxID=3100323 RepID=UPI002B4AF727|nr:hypothetical protein [Okeania sp.]MEB3339716.1 hypothetical protein [Okeania sp.]